MASKSSKSSKANNNVFQEEEYRSQMSENSHDFDFPPADPEDPRHDETDRVTSNGDDSEERIRKLSEMVDMNRVGEAEISPDDDLPLLTFENTTGKKGGNISDAGFARLEPGFEFVGFVLRKLQVPSQFGAEVELRDEFGEVLRDAKGKPILGKMQEVFQLFGTAKVPVRGLTGSFASTEGRMRIPVYERLKQPIEDLFNAEAKLDEKSPKGAKPKKIPVRVIYRGQEKDRTNEKGEKRRSGAHVFEVHMIRML